MKARYVKLCSRTQIPVQPLSDAEVPSSGSHDNTAADNASHSSAAVLPMCPHVEIFFFWYDKTCSKDAAVCLPLHLLHGLVSCICNTKLTAIVLAYQKLRGLPEGVVVEDCEHILEFEAFSALLDQDVAWLK